MRPDGEVNLEPPGMGLKPLQLLIECPKTADESLMAVTWGFGEEERLEGRQVFGEEIILREPAAEASTGSLPAPSASRNPARVASSHSDPAF